MREQQAVDLPKKRIVDFETSELVDELSAREEAKTSILAPFVEAAIRVSGPAKVVVVRETGC